MSLLILQIFPSFVGMVAIYVILMRVHGLNTLWGLILIYMAGNIPYNTWMVKSYMDMLPKSLDEAARIDGQDILQSFGKSSFRLRVRLWCFLLSQALLRRGWILSSLKWCFVLRRCRPSHLDCSALSQIRKIYLPLSQQDHFLWRCHLFCFSLSHRKC